MPRDIPVIGRSEESSNPLVLLAKVLDRQNEILAQIAKNTAPDDHTYALLVSGENMWTTYCLACSNRQQRLVYPCADPSNTVPPPPATFALTPDDTASHGG